MQYVGHRQAKEYYDDGRRRNLFFLIDQQGGLAAGWALHARGRAPGPSPTTTYPSAGCPAAAAGAEHLAVVGEERETRDGHYTYGTAPPFDSIRPLTCYNQTGVFHWLEGMINHHLGKGGLSALATLGLYV